MKPSHFIYIVDDQTDFRYILEQIFLRFLQSYTVRSFESGQALLDELAASRIKPNLILLDRHMPNLDGYQTLLQLKADWTTQPIPVIMMSADVTQQDINACYEAGANSFLEKKLDFQELKAMLARVCHYWLAISRSPIQQADELD